MSNENNNNSVDEQRRRKANDFRLHISDNYDDEGESGADAGPEEIS